MVSCCQCGRKIYGGTPERQAAGLCHHCWRSTPENRVRESARRKKNFAGKRPICDLTPGRRVRRVKLELFNNWTPPEDGTIVSAPVHIEGGRWHVEIRWDGRPSPQFVDVRRVSLCPPPDQSGALKPERPTPQ